jgi:hypothetical protein
MIIIKVSYFLDYLVKISVRLHFLSNRFSTYSSGLSGLAVACRPLVPKFAGSNLAEAVGFFRAKKSSARLPSEGK